MRDYFTDTDQVTCAQDSEYTKALGWSAAIIVQDVSTDLMSL